MLLLLAIAALAGPTAQVLPATGPITVDGSLSEDDWALAEPVTDFLRFRPTEGGAPPGLTEVRFLQDDRHLYVGIRVSGLDYPVRARISQREDINADDQIGIYLDTFQDHRSGYITYLNPLGIQQDIRVNSGRWNPWWDTLFDSRGQVTEDGFVLEVAYPFRSLRYPRNAARQTWGLILTRKVPHEGAKYSFPLLERNHPQLFAQAAELTGLEPPRQGAGLELVPTITAVQQGSRESHGDSMVWTGFDEPLQAVRPSVDLRYGLTPNTTVSASLNPDFSQVEYDETPIGINQRFAFWFDERRPFFLDGSDLFDDRHGTLYSRSIVEPLYAVKVGGKEGPIAVGLLHAVDRSPSATVHERGSPGFEAADVDGSMALDALGRIGLDAFGSGTAGLTFADKRILRDGALVGVHHEAAADIYLPLGHRWTWGAGSSHSFTRRIGEAGLYGYRTSASLNRSSGYGTGGGFGFSDTSRDARAELGFLTQSGVTSVGAWIDHTFEPETIIDVIQPWAVVGSWTERNGDSYREVEVGTSVTLGGVHSVFVESEASDRTEEGVRVGGWKLEAAYEGELGAVLSFSPGFEIERVMDFDRLAPAQGVSAWLDLTLRPTTGLKVEAAVLHERLVPRADIAELASRARLRVSWQFTRTLGLRVFEEYAAGTDADSSLLSSAVLTWLLHPGTGLWIGYAETTDLAGSPYATNRTIFAKVSLLARP